MLLIDLLPSRVAYRECMVRLAMGNVYYFVRKIVMFATCFNRLRVKFIFVVMIFLAANVVIN